MTTHNAKNAEEGRQPGLSPSSSDESPGIAKQSQKDSFLVTWKGKDDPENPKNWTKRQKWAATFVSGLPDYVSSASDVLQTPGCSVLHLHITRVFFHCRSCDPEHLRKLRHHEFRCQPNQLQCLRARLRVWPLVPQPAVRNLRQIEAVTAREPFLPDIQHSGRI